MELLICLLLIHCVTKTPTHYVTIMYNVSNQKEVNRISVWLLLFYKLCVLQRVNLFPSLALIHHSLFRVCGRIAIFIKKITYNILPTYIYLNSVNNNSLSGSEPLVEVYNWFRHLFIPAEETTTDSCLILSWTV